MALNKPDTKDGGTGRGENNTGVTLILCAVAFALGVWDWSRCGMGLFLMYVAGFLVGIPCMGLGKRVRIFMAELCFWPLGCVAGELFSIAALFAAEEPGQAFRLLFLGRRFLLEGLFLLACCCVTWGIARRPEQAERIAEKLVNSLTRPIAWLVAAVLVTAGWAFGPVLLYNDALFSMVPGLVSGGAWTNLDQWDSELKWKREIVHHIRRRETAKLKWKDEVIRDTTINLFIRVECDWQGMVFERCRFESMEIYGRLKGVTFRDCTFSSIEIVGELDGVELQNCVLEWGSFKSYRSQPGRLNFAWCDIVSSRYLVDGQGLDVRIADCLLDDAEVDAKSAYVTGSSLRGVNLFGQTVYTDDCSADWTYWKAQRMVIRDSRLRNAWIVPEEEAFLFANTYRPDSSLPRKNGGQTPLNVGALLLGDTDSHTVVAQSPEPADILVGLGGVEMRDIRWARAGMGWQPRQSGYRNGERPHSLSPTPSDSVPRLDLLRVAIGEGTWKKRVVAGRWESVRVEKGLVVEDTNLSGVEAYDLQFPDGGPWADGGEDGRLVPRASPAGFDWKACEVPAPADLGIRTDD